MNTKHLLRISHIAFGLVTLLSTINFPLSTLAQGTAFTYQGRLTDTTNPVNGLYDLRFSLYDASTGGTLVAGPVTNSPVVISNGLFTVTLDFGAGVFTGADRWLEIGARTNSVGTFGTLSPRQRLTPAPYAITAENLVSGGLAAGIYSNPVTFNNPANRFCGDGGCLTNVNATTLGGLTSTDFWRLSGNTISASSFLGTLNDFPLEIKVNNNHALRIVPASVPSLEGGYFQNSTHGFTSAAIVGGGTSGSINEVLGDYGFIGAGHGAKVGSFSAVVDGAYNIAPGQFSFNGSGLRNTNMADYSFIGSGGTNYIAPGAANSFIGGGTLNSNLVSWSVVVGGSRNSAAGAGAFVGGGGNNIAANFNVVVAGGANNLADANASAISGGSENHASGDHSYIGGGQANATSADDSAVGGGLANVVNVNADSGTIGGGYLNAIRDFASYASIGGGYVNLIQTNAYNSTIPGGDDNTIGPFAVSSVIGGGSYNSVQQNAHHTVLDGGEFNLIQTNSMYSTIGGGHQHIIQHDSIEATISGGFANLIEPNSLAATISGGSSNAIQTTANFSTISGGTNNLIHQFSLGSTIGGGSGNAAGGVYATVGGGNNNTAGDNFSTVCGGKNNRTADYYATVSGGSDNSSLGEWAVVGGGIGNTAAAFYSTIGGGANNAAWNQYATVSGGSGNVVTNNYGTVPGGYANMAGGAYSFAAGDQAQAVHQGSFVWADSQGTPFASTTNDQFCIRAKGGVQLSTDTSVFCGAQTRQMLNLWSTQYGIGVQAATEYFRSGSDFSWFKGGVHNDNQNNPGGGVEMMRLTSTALTVNGVFVSSSDRNLKENFEPVNGREVLEKVAALHVSKWNFKTDPESRHVGPMAQDFYSAFGLGADDKHITTVDEGGVALAAIQGLNQKIEYRDQQIQILKQQNDSLEQRLSQMENMLKQLTNHK